MCALGRWIVSDGGGGVVLGNPAQEAAVLPELCLPTPSNPVAFCFT